MLLSISAYFKNYFRGLFVCDSTRKKGTTPPTAKIQFKYFVRVLLLLVESFFTRHRHPFLASE